MRALDERWTRLFVSKYIRFLPLIAEATPACKLGDMAASDSFLQPDRKLQDVNAVSAFKTMFIVLVSQGKSRKSSEKCWYLDQESTRAADSSAQSTSLSVLKPRANLTAFRIWQAR